MRLLREDRKGDNIVLVLVVAIVVLALILALWLSIVIANLNRMGKTP